STARRAAPPTCSSTARPAALACSSLRATISWASQPRTRPSRLPVRSEASEYRMHRTQHRWGTIETRFAKFAAWIDDRGRLVRFNLSADGAPAVDAEALHDESAIADVRRPVDEYCAGERTEFDVD